MSERKKTSRGQALIMVSLALFAMAGMMGLAVDLGWSFFVQKQAQAAADGAALAAVQTALNQLRSGSSGSVAACTCGTCGGTGVGKMDCEAVTPCASLVGGASNLYNGCQYALKNGFNWTAGSNQNVTMESGDSTALPATAPGVVNLTYWVTVRTVQTIPQLFSAVLGHGQAVVSAVATAAIAASVRPGSFYGMNRIGDCAIDFSGTSHCGIDIFSNATGTTSCGGGGAIADVCAPAGMILASLCNSVSTGVCDDGFAGEVPSGSGKGAAGNSLVIMGTGSSGASGAVTGTWQDMSGIALTPIYSTNAATFQDPTAPDPQPPLQPTSAIYSCGISGGGISGGTLGPYQYYSWHAKDVLGVIIPDGNPITLSGTVTFSASGGCPGTLSPSGVSQSGSAFPTYIFYGGVSQNGTSTLGPGQYVMAGVNSGGASVGNVFYAGGTMTGDTATGTMFIFTDGYYPGLSTQMAALPNAVLMPTLYQGTLSFKNPTITLSGLVNSKNASSSLPVAMDLYTGITWWQDRRNSTVGYNEPSGTLGCGAECTGDNGSIIYCNESGVSCPSSSTAAKLNTMVTANHATSTSPGVLLDPGSGSIAMTGVYYQPRGAWLQVGKTGAGGAGTSAGLGPLQMVTGSLIVGHGGGGVMLAGPTNPFVTYSAVLIH